MEIKSHRDLVVWQKSMELVTQCYRLTGEFPNREKFGLSSQLQRAAVSIPANIAEGHARKTTRAFLNHLSIACGSLAELETHLEVAVRLKYLQSAQCGDALVNLNEISRMLDGLIKSLNRKLDSNS